VRAATATRPPELLALGCRPAPRQALVEGYPVFVQPELPFVVRIVTYAKNQELAWTVQGHFKLGHVYGYRLEAIDGGTLVTSYYDWSGVDQEWKDANVFPVIPESALKATLGILARTVAPGRPRPGA
jgi:hypothetical protein